MTKKKEDNKKQEEVIDPESGLEVRDTGNGLQKDDPEQVVWKDGKPTKEGDNGNS